MLDNASGSINCKLLFIYTRLDVPAEVSLNALVSYLLSLKDLYMYSWSFIMITFNRECSCFIIICFIL